MRFLGLILSFGLMFACAGSVGATANKAKTAKKKAVVKKPIQTSGGPATGHSQKSGELQTDVKFDDSVLHGQYQTPEEALARVENEKGLSDLIGVRKHFKDRLQTASGQE
jgi:hypothetical protein